MQCRAGCGACCIALSISSAIPGMATGKPAGVRCLQLNNDNKCLLYGKPERPAVCLGLKPSADMCGRNYKEAMANLEYLEKATEPDN
ncbi:MAG: zinc/iron-chelating domain-containing protein [Firmicutes bacterium HGW-Firmicutes-12]|nr:MAG: zinc/iron-chelating domain-containing protein [Firmicutes bacterium HGW-Firmicutes-12]